MHGHLLRSAEGASDTTPTQANYAILAPYSFLNVYPYSMKNTYPRRLEGKVALISGAAKGIGLAIARRFYEEGATVYISDIYAPEVIQTMGGIEQLRYLQLDVQVESAWEAALTQILDEQQHLDILVNNAGIIGLGESFGPQNPEEASLESWNRVHAVNLTGTFLGCKHAIKAMRRSPERGGAIVNMSSRSGLVGVPDTAAYASSKAAVRNHTKSVALYCGRKGYKIRCNSLNPADILTDMWEGMLGEGEARVKALRDVVAGIPLGHMGEPNDVANAAVFLASDDAKFITGAELNIDGGILAGSASAPRQHE